MSQRRNLGIIPKVFGGVYVNCASLARWWIWAAHRIVIKSANGRVKEKSYSSGPTQIQHCCEVTLPQNSSTRAEANVLALSTESTGQRLCSSLSLSSTSMAAMYTLIVGTAFRGWELLEAR